MVELLCRSFVPGSVSCELNLFHLITAFANTASCCVSGDRNRSNLQQHRLFPIDLPSVIQDLLCWCALSMGHIRLARSNLSVVHPELCISKAFTLSLWHNVQLTHSTFCFRGCIVGSCSGFSCGTRLFSLLSRIIEFAHFRTCSFGVYIPGSICNKWQLSLASLVRDVVTRDCC